MLTTTTTKTFALATLAAMVSTSTAYDGYITLYQDRDFWGYSTTLDLVLGRCVQVNGYMNNFASSAKWGGFMAQSGLKVGFYDSAICSGRGIAWAFDSPSFPSNFESDYINDIVSSVIVWKPKTSP